MSLQLMAIQIIGFTLNKSDEINTAIIGSVYNYTYTADADTAGNPGESVSRIITIIEADHPKY